MVRKLIEEFVSEPSGGERGLAVVAAFFETVRERFGIYQEIRRGVINAADAATRSAADLECVGPNGNVVLAVEVKERRIGDDDLHIAIAKARELEIHELIFCSEGIVTSQREQALMTIQNAWASGTNIYQTTPRELIRDVLPSAGEVGTKALFI
ncbi:MAG: restriction endonuclease, SacI family, partial [Alphaproteobacteria bacterium]